jgi:MFS family permease
MSEVLGRRIPLFLGYVLFAIFQIPVAVAQNFATICIGRFLSGFFASAPLAVVGGALADLWDPIPRAYAICVFAAGGFAGPVAGPIAGGFITESHLGWRWTSWITLIMAGLFGGIALLVVPETSAARILQLRAAKLRKETGNAAYHSKADENKLTLSAVTTVYLVRPFKMIVQEPILALITAYMSFLYGIVYLLFEAVSHGFLAFITSANSIPVPSILPRRTRLVPWRVQSPLRLLYRRHNPRRRCNRILYSDKFHTFIQQARKIHTGRTSPTNDLRRHRPSRRPVLVRMDIKSTHNVGAAGPCLRTHRPRVHGSILAGCELPD